MNRPGNMRALLLLSILALSLAVSACGKKGQLEVPPAEPGQADENANG
jgi:predicted small lipoprotein YifL